MIRYWLRGAGKELPGWVQILQAAEKWGVPPWQVEDQASRLWWERWRAWEDELASFRKEKAGEGAGQG